MSISINERTFALHTKNTTYMMQADDYGYLLHLYYGRKAILPPEYLLVKKDRGFSGNPYDALKDRTYSLDVLPQEFPFDGSGDFRSTSFSLHTQEGVYGCDLRFKKAEVIQGKTVLKGLPAMREVNAESLEITLEDSFLHLEVILAYSVYEDVDIITRSVRIINHGQPIIIDNIKSASLDFVCGNYDVISFYGRHTMERVPNRQAIRHGIYKVSSKRGTSSHQYNPALILCSHDATETSGDAYSMNFVYSGSFEALVEGDQYNQKRMAMGIAADYFAYPLGKEETFYAPEVMLSYSFEGLTKLSQNLHQAMNKYLIRDPYQGELRPILINSWESCYFDFDGEAIYQLAKSAKDCDIDMIVMDDGWFGKRNNDDAALGDWHVNEEKLGESLASLTQRIHQLGMKFGIWFEPECINEDSDLYRAHPDYALRVPHRKFIRSREQLVLDFSRQEVVDVIFNQVCDVLDHAEIDYIKWDFNRSISDLYSSTTIQGKVMYDYVLGLYDFLARLIKRYPSLLIEGCSGGGGRFDAGMLYYTPQIWLSDNTDAIDRLTIQYGSSFIYPISSFGSHVSAVPNHQNGRITPMNTRAVVSMSGSFGYELDITKLSDDERATIKNEVKTFKNYASLIHDGLYYRLTNPLQDEVGAYAFVSEDRQDALIFAVRIITHSARYAHFIKIEGLEENACYKDDQGHIYEANVLQTQGLPLIIEQGEYQAYTIHLTKQEGEKENGKN
jgi:alpha-galactosidase